VLVFFHGGGWVIGDLESHDRPCRSLTNLSGCCVVAVDYRLAPEARYPAAADDCCAATKWVADNAGEMHIDASRIAVGGGSAGGNLAAVVSLMARDKGRPEIRSQVLINPVTDFSFETASYKDNGEGFGLTATAMRWYWDCYLGSPDKGSQPYASPLQAEDLAGLPRALVITAEYDPLRDEGEAYGERLRAAGVPTTVTRYKGVVHGFVGHAPIVPEGRQALEQIGRELRDALA
jgi:acetyl esterase